MRRLALPLLLMGLLATPTLNAADIIIRAHFHLLETPTVVIRVAPVTSPVVNNGWIWNEQLQIWWRPVASQSSSVATPQYYAAPQQQYYYTPSQMQQQRSFNFNFQPFRGVFSGSSSGCSSGR